MTVERSQYPGADLLDTWTSAVSTFPAGEFGRALAVRVVSLRDTDHRATRRAKEGELCPEP